MDFARGLDSGTTAGGQEVTSLDFSRDGWEPIVALKPVCTLTSAAHNFRR